MEASDFNRRRFLGTLGMATVAGVVAPLYSANSFDNLSVLSKKDAKTRYFSNENPYGPSEPVKEVLLTEMINVNRYATLHKYSGDELISSIASRNEISKDQVILGHGSYEILTMLSRAFGTTKDSIIVPDLTFNIVGGFADRVFEHKTLQVPLDSAFKIDLEATKKAVTSTTKLVYLCNPNNPTGRLLDADNLEQFCNEVATDDCVVAIDEAYIELVAPELRPSTIKLLQAKKNVLIIRTFSKAYGLAGLRVGYAMGLEETIAKITKTHYNSSGLICRLGTAAAITALKDDEYINWYRQKNASIKKEVVNQLESMGYDCLESHTNFIFIKVMKAKRFKERLQEKGVFPVPGGWKKYPDWIRVSLATPMEMEDFIGIMKMIKEGK